MSVRVCRQSPPAPSVCGFSVCALMRSGMVRLLSAPGCILLRKHVVFLMLIYW